MPSLGISSPDLSRSAFSVGGFFVLPGLNRKVCSVSTFSGQDAGKIAAANDLKSDKISLDAVGTTLGG